MRETKRIRCFGGHARPTIITICIAVFMLLWPAVNPLMIGTGLADLAEEDNKTEASIISQYLAKYNVVLLKDAPIKAAKITLPENSIVINKPNFFYEAKKKFFLGAITVFSTLIIYIITLPVNIFRRLRAEQKLQKHCDHLEKLVKERTSELTEANKALKDVEEKFRGFSEAAFEGIVFSEKGTIIEVNKRYCDMFGYRSSEVIDQAVIDFVSVEERDDLKSKMMSGYEKPYEITALRKDGTTFPCSVQARMMNYQGRSVIVSAFQDITKRKVTEDGLLMERERLSTILDGSPISIFMINKDGRVVFWNRAFENISKLPREQALGKTLSESLRYVYPKKTPPILADIVLKMTDENLLNLYGHKIKKAGFGESFEATTSIWPDGIERIFDIIATRIRDHKGNILGAIQCAQDVTEKKRLEEQLLHSQKMESIGTLAGGIAHEFNNILGIIMGNAELAMEGISERDSARFNLEEIRTASLRAKDIVSQLLSFARKTNLEKKPTNIVTIIEESLKLLRSSIPTSIEIRQNISQNVDTILADATQLHQILINLFTNADHAMINGGVIEVTLKNVDLDENAIAQYPDLNPGRYVNLSISDDGKGIPKGEIDRIFDPYFSTKEVGKGTGMGLAVVHGIVKGHNGFISVESELEKGTTFSIFFPAIEKMAVLETKVDEKLPDGNERILFVDDEESMVKLGRLQLERLGYKVEASINPTDALEIFRSRPDQFDLIITDLTMPKMTGDKLVKEILTIRSDVPVILCTGFSERIDESAAKKIGAAEYIEKPINARDFALIIRKVLDEK